MPIVPRPKKNEKGENTGWGGEGGSGHAGRGKGRAKEPEAARLLMSASPANAMTKQPKARSWTTKKKRRGQKRSDAQYERKVRLNSNRKRRSTQAASQYKGNGSRGRRLRGRAKRSAGGRGGRERRDSLGTKEEGPYSREEEPIG